MEERRMWSHESLTLDLKSIPWKNTKGGRESIHYSIHLHFTRVAWFTGYSRTTASQHRRHSFHFTALVANHPENKPLSDDVHPRLSLEPDTCSSFPACTRLASSMGQSRRRNRRIRCVFPLVLLLFDSKGVRKGWQFFLFSSFFLLRRSNGMERRRGLEWKRDATKTKRRTFNERARDGVADRPRLNRADSEHVGLEWAWLSDGDGRSGSERDGQRSAGGWSGLVKWG